MSIPTYRESVPIPKSIERAFTADLRDMAKRHHLDPAQTCSLILGIVTRSIAVTYPDHSHDEIVEVMCHMIHHELKS